MKGQKKLVHERGDHAGHDDGLQQPRRAVCSMAATEFLCGPLADSPGRVPRGDAWVSRKLTMPIAMMIPKRIQVRAAARPKLFCAPQPSSWPAHWSGCRRPSSSTPSWSRSATARSPTSRLSAAIGVDLDGHTDIFGIWAGGNGDGESAKYWLNVLTELRNRGVGDVFFIIGDGLKGLPDSVAAAFLMALSEAPQCCSPNFLRSPGQVSAGSCRW